MSGAGLFLNYVMTERLAVAFWQSSRVRSGPSMHAALSGQLQRGTRRQRWAGGAPGEPTAATQLRAASVVAEQRSL